MSQDSLRKLLQDAEWVLEFLEQYPPHFRDGRSMDTDLGDGLSELAQSVERIREEIKGKPRRQRGLTSTAERLVLMALKQAGTYEPSEVLHRIEEQLTGPEYETLEGFLGWVVEARKPVVKRSGDMHGEFEIVVKLTRKRTTPERRRYLGYEEKT